MRNSLPNVPLQCQPLMWVGIALVYVDVQARVTFYSMGDGPRNGQLIDRFSLAFFDFAFVHNHRIDFAGFASDSFQDTADDPWLKLRSLQLARGSPPT